MAMRIRWPAFIPAWISRRISDVGDQVGGEAAGLRMHTCPPTGLSVYKWRKHLFRISAVRVGKADAV